MLSHALLIVAAIAQATPTGRYRCDRTADAAQVGGRAYTWIEVDAADRLLEAALSVGTRDFDATWDIEDRGLVLRRVELSAWAPPATAAYPITVRVIVDGRAVTEQSFDQSNVTLVDFVEAAGSDSRTTRMRPGLDLAPITALPELIGAGRIELDTVDASGASVERRPLSLPNWTAITAFHDDAYHQIGQERAARRCKQTYQVIAW